MVAIRWFVFALMLASQTGCILLWEVQERHVPDPQEGEYRRLTAVRGNEFTLEDGRKFVIAGVDLSVARERQHREYLDELVGQYVLPLPEGEGKARFVTGGGPGHMRGQVWREFPVLVLIPIKKDVPPHRTDVGLDMVRKGIAGAKAEELGKRSVRRRYRAAQAKAQDQWRGIWFFKRGGHTMEQKLVVAILDHNMEEARYLLECSPGRLQGAELAEALVRVVSNARITGVEMLLAHGADVNAAASGGVTPLAAAVRYSHGQWPVPGHAEMVELLLKHGARVNQASEEGWTPLMLAARAGNLEVVNMLLDARADATLRRKSGRGDKRGRTALDEAKDTVNTQDGERWREVVTAMQARGVKE